VYVGVSSVEIKTEADITEYSHVDMPSTGMFAVSDDTFFAVSCIDDLKQRLVCLLFLGCLCLSCAMFAVYFVLLSLCSYSNVLTS